MMGGGGGAGGGDCSDQPDVTYTDYEVPDSIVHDGSADASDDLNTWLANSVPNGTDATHQSRVVFPGGAPNTYRMDVGLQFTNRNNLAFQGNGATLQVGPGASGGDQLASPLVFGHDYALGYWTGANTRITVSGLNFVGNSPHPGVFEGGEGQASIELEASTEVEICGCTSIGAWGDFVKIGSFAQVTIYDNHIIDAGRNGISVISGSDIEIRNNEFDTIGYVTLDIEPNDVNESCQSISFHDNSAGTWGQEFFAMDGSHTGAAIDHVTIDHNTISGSSLLTYVNNGNTTRNTDINFTNNVSTGPAVAGPVLNFAYVDGLVVTHNTQPLSSGELVATTDCTNATTSPNP